MNSYFSDQIKMHIANSLYKFRIEVGYSSEKACQKLNINEDLLLNYENGTVSPPASVVVTILQAYNIQPIYFFINLQETVRLLKKDLNGIN